MCNREGGAMYNPRNAAVTMGTTMTTNILQPTKRFGSATLEDSSAMKEARFEENTVNSTKWG